MPPRVLYDLSLLGFCKDDPAKITGMPRVILEQAIRLQASPECETTFCATEDPADAYRFVRAHHTLKHARMAALSEDGAATLGSASLQAAQVFHTPHSAVPDVVRQYPKVSVIQTVYDMIPFLLPETMTAEYRDYYADILRRIRPEDRVITISQSAKADFCNHTGFAEEPRPRRSARGERGVVPALPRFGTHGDGARQIRHPGRTLSIERFYLRAPQKSAAFDSLVRGTAQGASRNSVI